MKAPCSIPDCERLVNAHGWCHMHYRRWQVHGDPLSDVPTQLKVRVLLRESSTAPCRECEREFPAEGFARNRSVCKECHNAIKRRQWQARRPSCVDCGEPCTPGRSGTCKSCLTIRRRATPDMSRRWRAGSGYIALPGYYDHPNADAQGRILEHVKVMSETLGRPLRKGENVHHKNGVRDDNRPENLELWVVSQPYGQRPADLVAWAREILARYEGEVAA